MNEKNNFPAQLNSPAQPAYSDRREQNYNRYQNTNRLAAVIKSMEDLRKKVSLTDDQFIAEVLYVNTLTIDEFKEKLGKPENSKFVKKILNSKTSDDTPWTVQEIYVSIPIITGMLPYPSFEDITRARNLIVPQSPPGDQATADKKSPAKNQETIKRKGKTELEKIAFYPRAYRLVKDDAAPNTRQNCIVKFPSQNSYFPSRFAMEYVSLAKEVTQKQEGIE